VPVKIGNDYGSTVEIVSGLRPSDEVIANPSDSLTNGSPVRVLSARPAEGAGQ
jgi:multidrug efflux pump subunit AcrA (membrane-fusion protein)